MKNPIKTIIKKLFLSLGYTIASKRFYDNTINDHNLFISKSLKYYEYYLKNKADLSESEILEFLEMKYGGPVFSNPNRLTLGSAAGGDRMSPFFHSYSLKYSEYLSPLRQSEEPINILEVGILKGTGLAIWSDYFERKRIHGFDYDLSNFENNIDNLLELGAFKDGLPVTKFFDQFSDNTEILRETFGDKKLHVVIDDAFHSDESIINTFEELQPYLAQNFVYFIEDNRTAWKNLQVKYPQYNFDYNDNQIAVVKKK